MDIPSMASLDLVLGITEDLKSPEMVDLFSKSVTAKSETKLEFALITKTWYILGIGRKCLEEKLKIKLRISLSHPFN